MIEVFGLKMTVLFGLALVLYLLIAFAPVIWPAVHAFRKQTRLERPWLFTGTIGALTYGMVYMLAVIISVPAQAYLVFIAPSLEEFGKPYGSWLVATVSAVAMWWWLALPASALIITVVLTRRLAAKWSGICSALT